MNELGVSSGARRWTSSCGLVSRTMSMLSVRLVAVMSCLVFAFVPSQQQDEREEEEEEEEEEEGRGVVKKKKKTCSSLRRNPWKKSLRDVP